jgi:SAM-dependent methyltransferase
MLTGNSDEAWREYGRTEPYYGVLSDERFRQHRLTPESLDEFFRSGELYVQFILKTIQHHFEPRFAPKRVLEFGCGVGRLAIPLARAGEAVVAVDISEDMIKEATRNCASRGISNIEFVRSDDRLSAVHGRFDLAVSYLVFQHLASRRAERISKMIVERLEAGGIGCLHFNYAGPGSRPRRLFHHLRKVVPLLNNFANLAEARDFFTPMMQMNRSNLNRLLALLQDAGCGEVLAHFTDHGGERGVMLFFQKTGEAALEFPNGAY